MNTLVSILLRKDRTCFRATRRNPTRPAAPAGDECAIQLPCPGACLYFRRVSLRRRNRTVVRNRELICLVVCMVHMAFGRCSRLAHQQPDSVFDPGHRLPSCADGSLQRLLHGSRCSFDPRGSRWPAHERPVSGGIAPGGRRLVIARRSSDGQAWWITDASATPRHLVEDGARGQINLCDSAQIDVQIGGSIC